MYLCSLCLVPALCLCGGQCVVWDVIYQWGLSAALCHMCVYCGLSDVLCNCVWCMVCLFCCIFRGMMVTCQMCCRYPARVMCMPIKNLAQILTVFLIMFIICKDLMCNSMLVSYFFPMSDHYVVKGHCKVKLIFTQFNSQLICSQAI